MSEQRMPTPHHVYDEEKELESFSVSREMGSIIAQVVYVQDVTPVPSTGQIAEFRVLGTIVYGTITYASLMTLSKGDVQLHIQATRIQD